MDRGNEHEAIANVVCSFTAIHATSACYDHNARCALQNQDVYVYQRP